uniref:Roadblock/LAMTOR2 domain-containing protein n=2 Tax=cellular organisms TaxID=131567 RepID=A0AA39CS69_9EURO|nr:hypothetical protein H2204_012493 [Knufia peltigerae]
MGSGKSTLVRSIAAGAVVDTDVANSDRAGADKASTTVALDYADIDLPNGERLRLYGTPGQQRFDFLWPILLQGARGAVLLLDARRAGVAAELDAYLQVLRPFGPALALVVAVTHLDQVPAAALDDWAERARLDGQPLPLLAVDAPKWKRMHWWPHMADGQGAPLPDAQQRERLQPLLQDLQQRVEGVRTVVLASVDGFALVSAGAEGRGERLAAMTSAMLALAAAVGRELALGDLQTLMLEAAGGKVLMLAIQAEGRAPLLLMAACDQRSVIGQVLWQSRECGQAILAELSGS